jgi:hypothetical protein
MSNAIRRRPAGRAVRSQLLPIAQHHQTQRKSNREEELRHDCVRVTAIRVVMFENRMHRRKTAGKIHEQHPATV